MAAGQACLSAVLKQQGAMLESTTRGTRTPGPTTRKGGGRLGWVRVLLSGAPAQEPSVYPGSPSWKTCPQTTNEPLEPSTKPEMGLVQ